MANNLNEEDYEEARSIYSRMRGLQSQLWALASELEELIGCAVDTTEDLTSLDMSDFIDRDEAV
jgi:hypothetical protein